MFGEESCGEEDLSEIKGSFYTRTIMGSVPTVLSYYWLKDPLTYLARFLWEGRSVLTAIVQQSHVTRMVGTGAVVANEMSVLFFSLSPLMLSFVAGSAMLLIAFVFVLLIIDDGKNYLKNKELIAI